MPILVYFKETQTPESQWGVGPGEMANSAEAFAEGRCTRTGPPALTICNAKQMLDSDRAAGVQEAGDSGRHCVKEPTVY